MLLRLFLITFLLLWQIALYGQNDYTYFPPYTEVVTNYFSHYSKGNISEENYLKFEKKPDGWHVVITPYETDKPIIRNEVLWSSSKKTFQELSFIKKPSNEDNSFESNKFLLSWSISNYNVCPYYGYPGWELDVIKNYKNAKHLPDSILYGLGRAYSSLASNLLNDNSGLSDDKLRYKLKEGQNALSAQQLAEYRQYRHRAIEIFKEVAQLNPNLETIVGKIGLKYANEYMVAYLDLLIYQNETEARKELRENLYDDFYLSYAKNFLTTCQKNAILFTSGDTDTYTLLYAQEFLGIRKDVTVINTSLLQTPRYINFLRRKTEFSEGINLTLQPQHIDANKLEVVLINPYGKEAISLITILEQLKDPKHTITSGNQQYAFIEGQYLSHVLDAKQIEWSLCNASYLYLSQIMLLDIIYNAKERPIYFSTAMETESYIGLESLLALEGLAYKLVNYTPDTQSKKNINTEKLFQNLMDNFTWEGNETVLPHDGIAVYNYLNAFYWLSDALILEGEKEKAEKVLDKYFTLFNNTTYAFDDNSIPLIEAYYRVNANEKGNKITKELIDNLKNGRNNRIGSRYSSSTLQNTVEILDKLEILAREYKQIELNELVKKARTSVN